MHTYRTQSALLFNINILHFQSKTKQQQENELKSIIFNVL